MSAKPNKVRNRVGLINKQIYKAFIQKHPSVDVSEQQFLTILKESTKTIRDHILENPLGFKLPYELGYIAVDKFKGLKDYFGVNWIETRRLGKLIPLLNLHSFGYFFKVKFYPNPRIKPLQVYKMNAHRKLNRMLAKKIKEGKEYIPIDKSYYSNRFKIGQTVKQG